MIYRLLEYSLGLQFDIPLLHGLKEFLNLLNDKAVHNHLRNKPLGNNKLGITLTLTSE